MYGILIRAKSNNNICVVGFAGAGEDVEGVLTRLQAQASENALLRERQAKASSDLQVLTCTQGGRGGGTQGVGGSAGWGLSSSL